jgi:signal transduction histidine kinase
MLPQQAAVSAAMADAMKDSPMYKSYVAIAPRPEDFPRLLDAMGELMRQDYDWSTSVKQLTMPVLLVYGDADQLHQVLANLLVNAQQALQTVPLPRRLRAVTGTDGEAVWVAVTDNGPGIPAGIVNRIFDPFFTTKPQGKGTGLGLSISYGIARDHGGRIDVDSTPGKGSTFTLRLPRRTAQEPLRA